MPARPTDVRLALLVAVSGFGCGVAAPGLWESRAFCWVVHGSAALSVIGLLMFFAWYRWVIPVVFNRSPRLGGSLGPVWALFMMTKPLELGWRLATARFRVLPDICIIGEVRCGTTTLAAHLLQFPGAVGPWCGFIHPLDGKESFYFAGHYFGLVAPAMYRMVFPLALTRWFYRSVLGRPYLVFDGCAQYLTAPWAPELLAAAAGPGLKLLVCLRDPVDQNVSWWRFEHGFMGFGDSIGLAAVGAGIPEVRSRYPPATLEESHALSIAPDVAAKYQEAERLGAEVARGAAATLPGWALTWPNGQLSAAARNGVFADNIARWLKWFPRENFEFIELSELSSNLAGVLGRVEAQLPAGYRSGFGDKAGVPAVRLNASGQFGAEPSKAALEKLARFYRPHNQRLFKLIGRRFDHWK